MRQYKNIPIELKELKQWVCWGKPGAKERKQPFNPITNSPAKADKPTTWATYEDAVKAVKSAKYEGIGFMLTYGYIGIDLDHVITKRGLTSEAKEIIEAVDSYTEISPSGTGIHILVKGNIKLDKNKNKIKGNEAIEMYAQGRYFTITGNVYDKKSQLKSRTIEASKIYDKYLKSDKKLAKEAYKVIPSKPITIDSLEDKQLLTKMFNSKQGNKIKALFYGDITGYNSASEATLALCNYLVFWSNKNKDQIDRIIRSSGLYRQKWDTIRPSKEDYKIKSTWGYNLINEAISNFKGHTYAEYKKSLKI